ncbi:restriction endonuclease subunit S [uncultured Algoriphagus sp.]|uniref:restriction endonuclease subunit S n=1 Tax=uncultured Algoriphagus sp. TaxID=417365 RepID=UPI0030ED13D0|tara:strand:- start:5185 stop:6468 length:1284 start_codon:yes stop_codon:yes gene_type:complete
MKKDWIEVELGNVLVQSKERYKPDGEQEHFYVGLEHIAKEIGTLTDSNRIEKITTLKNKFESGQILYGKLRPYLNKVYLAKESGVCSTDILVFHPTDLVFSKFAHLYMLSRKFVNHMSENTSGVNLPRVSTSYINSYPFPLPSLPEQRAIVARIEELFSDLDHAIANLKSAQSKLEIYRQAVLKKAFEGGYSNGKDWEWKKFKDCGSWKGGGTPSKANHSFWQNGSVLWVSPKDMKEKIISDTIDKITKEAIDNSSAKWIKSGSILFVVRSGILRRTLPIAISKFNLTVNQDLQAFTPNLDLDPVFVYWFCKSRERDIRETCAKDGTTVESVDSMSLKNYLIPISPQLEQLEIVQEIESRLSVADKLAETIQTNLQKSESLRQSILKKAFEGKLLTEAELDTCRKESGWEPAEKMLERIKKNRKINK